MSSQSEKLPGQGGEVTEPQAISPAENLGPGPVPSPPDATVKLFSEGDGRKGDELDLELPRAPLEGDERKGDELDLGLPRASLEGDERKGDELDLELPRASLEGDERKGDELDLGLPRASLEGDEGEGDERKGDEQDLELPRATLEPTNELSGSGQVRRVSIDSTGTGGGSHRRSDRGSSSSSSSSSSSGSASGDDLFFQPGDPFEDPPTANKPPPAKTHEQRGNLPLKVTLQLAFQSIGVVFGDLGASPLFVYDSAFGGAGASPSEDNVLGALSLIIYTITLVPLIKYILIVLIANDNGNGETFALYSLICRCARIKVATYQIPEDHKPSTYNLLDEISKNRDRRELPHWLKEKLQKSKLCQNILLLLALFGTVAYIGDGVLTPAISVLGAMSGITTRFPSTSEDTVTYGSAGILVILFCIQRSGTDRVSFLFSPFISAWFICIFAIGAYNVQFYPAVFKAFNPYYIYLFFESNPKQGFVSLAGIVLAITGSESIVTDMGHFSVASIQIAFSTLVYPSLLVAYIGQAAYLIHDPSVIEETFYKSTPRSLFWPVFVMANATAIIASQGMISSTFCIIEQCMSLGCFPRCKVVHTSKKFEGQIYIPEVNWSLMLLTVAVTIGFKTTGKIKGAYGLAVVSVMLVTTVFVTLIMIMVWHQSLWIAGAFLTVFMVVETVYYSSVLYKIPQGGWVPVTFVGVVYSMMYIWHYGRKHRYLYEIQHKISTDWVSDLGSSLHTTRVQGVAFLYSELADGVPTIFAHLTSNLKAIHSILVFVCVKHLPIAHVLEEERLVVRRSGPKQFHMYLIAVRYGYADQKGTDVDFERRLIDSLATYIAADNSQPDQLEESGSDINGGLRKHVSSNASNSDFSVVFPAVPHQPACQEATAALAILEQSRRTGVVYFVGRVEVKAAEGSSTVRRYIIDKAYNFLRKNCRARSVGLNVPSSRIVQIGMLHRI